jgi:hypothetical protein
VIGDLRGLRRASFVVLVLILAGCSTSYAGTPSASSPWAASGGGDQVESRSAGRPPEFPARVDGFALVREWRETTRVFEGLSDWSTLVEFPATMNGCGMQRFYVRWRASDPDAEIEATLVSSPDLIVMVEWGTGAVGWMAGSGCAQPAFRMGLLPGDATLTDVVVEVQQWESAV